MHQTYYLKNGKKQKKKIKKKVRINKMISCYNLKTKEDSYVYDISDMLTYNLGDSDYGYSCSFHLEIKKEPLVLNGCRLNLLSIALNGQKIEKKDFTCIPAGSALDDEHTITNDDFPVYVLTPMWK